MMSCVGPAMKQKKLIAATPSYMYYLILLILNESLALECYTQKKKIYIQAHCQSYTLLSHPSNYKANVIRPISICLIKSIIFTYIFINRQTITLLSLNSLNAFESSCNDSALLGDLS